MNRRQNSPKPFRQLSSMLAIFFTRRGHCYFKMPRLSIPPYCSHQRSLPRGRRQQANKWLLNQLVLHLQPYMQYKCVARKLGTLLYPRDNDVFKCLTIALYDRGANYYIATENSLTGDFSRPHTSSLLSEKLETFWKMFCTLRWSVSARKRLIWQPLALAIV